MLWKIALAGGTAGIVNGLLGAGGGMVLIPLLSLFSVLKEEERFPAAVSIMAPMCIVTLIISALDAPLPWSNALPYLIGSTLGGIIAGLLAEKIPTVWLHRLLGGLILWGGLRYLC